MVNAFEIPLAKALYGAVFVPYLVYGFLYCIEGCKYQFYKQEET